MRWLKALQSFASAEEIKQSILEPHLKLLHKAGPVYIFGAQILGQKILAGCKAASIEVIGFIDNDPNKKGQLLLEKPILALDELGQNKEATIIIASTTYCSDIQEQLEKAGFKNILPHSLLPLFNPAVFKAEPTFENLQEDLIANKEKYFQLWEILADDRSKEVLDNLIGFRLTLDAKLLASISDPVEKEYFDPTIIALKKEEVFIDGGAFNGDTALKFIQAAREQYKQIYLFEPDQALLAEAKKRLNTYANLKFIGKGLFSKKTTLKFQATGKLDGFITKSGNIEIAVTALDEEIKEKITFLKLDVEGAEQEALKGAQKHIQEEHPKLAISVYHQSQDLWKLPELIKIFNKSYKFSLRHYSNTNLDTVLYAYEH